MKIMLVCSAGMSTSMLVVKMEKAAAERGVKAEIFALAEAEAKSQKGIDVVLLGPQVRFLLAQLKGVFEPQGTPVEVIDSINYGTMNGSAVLDQALGMKK
ncbi:MULTISPECIES: PTS sugar transporter subunit IIB [unclassified Fusibacter]|uniref:PTS sugar transporter subunit IIB n=1 Tax=unclassified Fusibacter TaxID=2624464 RepID=UPI001010C7BB|nr:MULTISPECIES: PTS sugar transporter subunit IIB [unclassified Fusibacter]MCK8059377.1 PTS sugar transporter subunit IIB [Fusibacter sp. A2]NPE21159.1 PTS sugar transporter subunit IIB [Fusibacter sp. A1]RXV62427.1 PTS sugar transporter subunit IIB [Fusibacter sp. A1]